MLFASQGRERLLAALHSIPGNPYLFAGMVEGDLAFWLAMTMGREGALRTDKLP
ncbi:hypothetical protein U879_07170 [Defluviimonas sp. 20V17]|nr:hypothetical protein U879_07170 [Defluviimonas sp. 20V17]